MHHTHLSNLPPIQMFFLIAVLFIGLAAYFYPTILAIKKNSPHTAAVVILNLFFGFTLIGWIVALVLASKQPQQVVVVYNTPPPRAKVPRPFMLRANATPRFDFILMISPLIPFWPCNNNRTIERQTPLESTTMDWELWQKKQNVEVPAEREMSIRT